MSQPSQPSQPSTGESPPTQPSSQPTAPSKPKPEELNPALKPVLARHGQELMEVCLRVGTANMILDWMLTYSHTHSKLQPRVAALMEAQSDLISKLVAAKGWTWEQLAECLQDIDRAARLAGATAGPSGGN